jgi:DHA1 family bicyclomycin/chloramphenicol resistance-like MFS transporter
MSFVYILGTFMCRRLLPRLGVRRSVAVAGVVTLCGGTLVGALALAGVQSGWAIVAPYLLFMLGHGVHQPCGQSGAVAPFPYAAGAASALNGFLMMVVAFAVGGWVGVHLDGTVHALTNGVWFWSVCIAAIAWTLVQRHGEPPRA